jgi:hypothetical protein
VTQQPKCAYADLSAAWQVMPMHMHLPAQISFVLFNHAACTLNAPAIMQ